MNENTTQTEPFIVRMFPPILRWCGLILALYEGFIERPPQLEVIGLAIVMMAGAPVLEKLVEKRGL